MIHAVTVEYRLPGHSMGDTRTATYSVVQKDEAAAFAQAVEQLKVDLLVSVIDDVAKNGPMGRRDLIRGILRVEPWARDYAYTPLGEAITYPTYYHGSK